MDLEGESTMVGKAGHGGRNRKLAEHFHPHVVSRKREQETLKGHPH